MPTRLRASMPERHPIQTMADLVATLELIVEKGRSARLEPDDAEAMLRVIRRELTQEPGPEPRSPIRFSWDL